MTRKHSAILVGLVLAAVLIVGVIYLGIEQSKVHYYEGTEVFPTEEEYSDFKCEIGNPNIDNWDVTVLSFNPPIVVKFIVRISTEDYTFPYGEADVRTTWDATVLLYAAAACLGLLVSCLIWLWGKKER